VTRPSSENQADETVCCIYHKPKAYDESSDESESDCDHDHHPKPATRSRRKEEGGGAVAESSESEGGGGDGKAKYVARLNLETWLTSLDRSKRPRNPTKARKEQKTRNQIHRQRRIGTIIKAQEPLDWTVNPIKFSG